MSTIPPVTSLEQLIRIIHTGPGYDGYAVLMKSITFGIEELKPFCEWDGESYHREVLEAGDGFELILMCWKPGQESVIHGHNNAQSWIRVIEGELIEHYYYPPKNDEPLVLRGVDKIQAGQVCFINRELGVHKVASNDQMRTVSLHLYSSTADTVKVYDEKTGESHPENIHENPE